MSPRIIAAISLGLALLGGLGLGLFVFGRGQLPSLAPAPADSSVSQIATIELGQPRPEFSLGSTTGAIRQMREFDGQLVLVNFWATWCAPCREEMPMLQKLSAEVAGQDVVFIGIALDDVARVRDFVDDLGITYPILVGGPDVMTTSRRWGNTTGALPYSVLVDREGFVRWRHFGPLLEEELRKRLMLAAR